LTIKDLITLMIIVSDNSATDMLFEKVGGTEPVNKLMQSYGLNTIKATGPSEVWFKALRAEPDAWKFHTEGKTPYGLSSPRDMGKLLEKIHKGEAVSKQASEQMLQIMRGQVYSSRLPKYVTGFRVPHKTGDFLPYIGNDVGILESANRHIVISVFTARHNGIGPNLRTRSEGSPSRSLTTLHTGKAEQSSPILWSARPDYGLNSRRFLSSSAAARCLTVSV